MKLIDMVSSLYDIRQQRAALEKTEKAVLVEIKQQVDPELDRLSEAGEDTSIGIGKFVLTRITGTSRVISADLLLGRGVAPNIVFESTKVTPYFQYKVKEQERK